MLNPINTSSCVFIYIYIRTYVQQYVRYHEAYHFYPPQISTTHHWTTNAPRSSETSETSASSTAQWWWFGLETSRDSWGWPSKKYPKSLVFQRQCGKNMGKSIGNSPCANGFWMMIRMIQFIHAIQCVGSFSLRWIPIRNRQLPGFSIRTIIHWPRSPSVRGDTRLCPKENDWLVVGLPLWKIWLRQLGW